MKFKRYKTRFQAGEILSKLIKNNKKQLYNYILEKPGEFFCFSIPNGGVPVAESFCSMLNIKYDMLIVRKIKIPWNTEAGFGSITTDGTVLINESLLKQLNLSEKEVKDSINLTKNEIEERLKFYGKSTDLENIYDQNVCNNNIFIIDDGLASGFTMLAAINMVKNYLPKKIYVAVPTAPLHTAKRVESEVDDLFCPNIRNVWRFAVADAYLHWYDIPESEVLEILKKSKYYLK
ncbi:MAG: phosphoribosyltransferase [Promethearchaeota archaeon]